MNSRQSYEKKRKFQYSPQMAEEQNNYLFLQKALNMEPVGQRRHKHRVRFQLSGQDVGWPIDNFSILPPFPPFSHWCQASGRRDVTHEDGLCGIQFVGLICCQLHLGCRGHVTAPAFLHRCYTETVVPGDPFFDRAVSKYQSNARLCTTLASHTVCNNNDCASRSLISDNISNPGYSRTRL